MIDMVKVNGRNLRFRVGDGLLNKRVPIWCVATAFSNAVRFSDSKLLENFNNRSAIRLDDVELSSVKMVKDKGIYGDFYIWETVTKTYFKIKNMLYRFESTGHYSVCDIAASGGIINWKLYKNNELIDQKSSS